MYSLRYLLFIGVLILGHSLSHAEEICSPSSKASLSSQSQDLWMTSCVSTCSKVLKKESPKQLDYFNKNCHAFEVKRKKTLTVAAGAENLKHTLDAALLKCLPLAAKNTVVGTYELVKALPSIVGYLLSGAWAKNIDSERAEALEFCKGSIECRRAMARNTIRYQNRNPDGSWLISDAEVDQQIVGIDFYDLHRQAIHDVPISTQECVGFLGALRGQMARDGEEWTSERHNKVFRQLAQQHPHCPGLLKSDTPAEKPAEEKNPPTQAECFAQNKESPVTCLSTGEKISVGLVCFGEDFKKEYDEAMIEMCATVVEVIIPLPGAGKVSKVIDVISDAKNEIAVVAEGAQLSESASVKILSGPQKNFVKAYKNRVFVSEGQNNSYISLASDSAKTVGENKTRFFDVENSVMKKLNDKTSDKELVTSLTNYQKETLLTRLEPLKQKYPQIDFEVYSDFKSVKVAMKSKTPMDEVTNQRLLADLNRVYGESNKEFASKMKELEIQVPEAGEPSQWFKAGYGRSVDEAALAARKARQQSQAVALDYSHPEVRQEMSESLSLVESKRKVLASSKNFSSLMEKRSDGISLPREDVFDLVRKNETPESLAQAISKRYDLKSFSAKEAMQLQEYVKGVDEFSPTVLIPKRETVNLDEAHHGGLSADFLGMGAANLRATAEGIAQKNTLESALVGAREGEKKVTGLFKQRMERFKKIVGDASCSGDDCAMAKLLTEREKLQIMQKLAKNPETRGVRMSFIGSNVSTETRMKLASHGESIEKAFRKELEGKIPYAKLNKMSFGFDMKANQLNQGSVNLVLGKSRATRLSSQEQQQMQEAFKRALEKHNTEKAAGYRQGTSSFSAAKVFWVPGAGILISDEPE